MFFIKGVFKSPTYSEGVTGLEFEYQNKVVEERYVFFKIGT